MPIQPARLHWPEDPPIDGIAGPHGDPDSPHARPTAPLSLDHGEAYHPQGGADAQCRRVFLGGNRLPERWQGRTRFVILETGFGLGHNFLSTWQAWRQDPLGCDHLVFLSVEKHPLTQADLQRAHRTGPDRYDTGRQALSEQLVRRWPPRVEGWHWLSYEEPAQHGPSPRRITLQLGLGEVGHLLPGLVAEVDAFYLDGFSPECNPAMWDPQWLSRLDRLAAPGATVAAVSFTSAVRDSLTHAGFTVERSPGLGRERDMLQARFTPRHVPAAQPGGLRSDRGLARSDRQALVLGSGLAGCAAAWALTREGWTVQLLDRHAEPAREASGNAGGLFHAIVHAEDGLHARGHRHAALHTAALTGPWVREGRLPGSVDGLLRLEPRLDPAQAAALLERLALPSDHLRWLNRDEAAEACGLPVPSGGWWLGQAGWLSPADQCRLLLDEAAATGGLIRLPPGEAVTLRPPADPAEPTADHGEWALLDARGQVLGSAPVVVLANAGQLPALLGSLPASHATALLPLSRIRGQTTVLNPHADVRSPSQPVAGGGYALTLSDGRVLCGATTLHHDDDPSVRLSDHRHNLAQARRLGVITPNRAGADPDETADGDAALHHVAGGRTGWRATTPDRFPLVGALPWHPDLIAAMARPPLRWQPRQMPRHRGEGQGLFVLGGLGSRGITWHVLAARLLAHWVCGTPCPVEDDLRDAFDPARFLVRQQRKPGPAD